MGKPNANTRGYTMGNNFKNPKQYTNKKRLLENYNLAIKNKYYKTKKANKSFLAGWRLSKKDKKR